MKASIAAAQRPEVVGGLGGFAGLFDASALRAYKRPLLATSTDGVGTKVAIAQRMGVHDTIGIDLVAHGRRRPRRLRRRAALHDRLHRDRQGRPRADRRDRRRHRRGLPAGRAARCVGGETAEHPGLLAPDEYDVAGAGTGVVEADALLGPDRVRAGDVARRHAVERAALQRLLAGPARAARRPPGWPCDRTSPSSAARWARSCSSRPGSTPSTAWRWRAPSRSACTR